MQAFFILFYSPPNSLSIKELRARGGPALATRWGWMTYAGLPNKNISATTASPAKATVVKAIKK